MFNSDICTCPIHIEAGSTLGGVIATVIVKEIDPRNIYLQWIHVFVLTLVAKALFGLSLLGAFFPSLVIYLLSIKLTSKGKVQGA